MIVFSVCAECRLELSYPDHRPCNLFIVYLLYYIHRTAKTSPVCRRQIMMATFHMILCFPGVMPQSTHVHVCVFPATFVGEGGEGVEFAAW